MRGCHFYYVDAMSHAIYGMAEESAIIREVKLPSNIEVNASFIFRIDTLDMDIVNTYIDFAMLDDIKWALFPLIKCDEFKDYKPMFKPVTEYKLWTVISSASRLEVEFLDLYGVDGVKETYLRNTLELINGFFASRQMLSSIPIQFRNMDRSPIVREVFTSKASMGTKYLPLYFDSKRYGIFLFKNLFTLNKNDNLTIIIRDRVDQPELFEACFSVVHEKNSIKFIINGDFIENTYATFVNV